MQQEKKKKTKKQIADLFDFIICIVVYYKNHTFA